VWKSDIQSCTIGFVFQGGVESERIEKKVKLSL
jgi:hypothetical protein